MRSAHKNNVATCGDAANRQVVENKKTSAFVDSLMQMQGSKLECASGRTHVRSDRMNSAADAAGAQNTDKKRMSALTRAMTSDDDIDAAGAQNTDKKRMSALTRAMTSDDDIDAADVQNIEKKSAAYARKAARRAAENIAAQAARMLAAKREHSAASLPYLPPACAGRRANRQAAKAY